MEAGTSSKKKKPEKKFTCSHDGCSACFSNSRKLTNHIRRHTGERPYVCDEEGCDKTYTNSSHLLRHKKTSHQQKENPDGILCEHEGCGLVLSNKYNLRKHYARKHNPENYAFICHECSQGFHRKRLLQQHIYLHTGQAPFSCDKCTLSFTKNSALNKHKRSHREYTCDCGEVFHRWSLLLKHRKKCRDLRFTCEVCDKAFSQLVYLKNHKLTHEDASKRALFACGYKGCDRVYLYKKNLVFHIKNGHWKMSEAKKITCTYPGCKIILKSKQSLKQHLMRHFKFTKKRKRKPRKDKGIRKKSMASLLSGMPTALEGIKETSGGLNDEILKQCEKGLNQVKENVLVPAN